MIETQYIKEEYKGVVYYKCKLCNQYIDAYEEGVTDIKRLKQNLENHIKKCNKEKDNV